jgi:hypothetical protein
MLLPWLTYTIECACKDSHAEEQTIPKQEFVLHLVGTDQIGTARNESRLEHAHQES